MPTRGDGDGDGDGDGSARYACRVGVVDLDINPSGTPRWLALDREISAHWVASNAGRDAGGDAGVRREETVVGGG